MNSPFQNKFIAKSPLRSHEGKLKRLDKKIAKADAYNAQGSKDYDYLADLQRQRKHLVESHNDPSTKRTEEEDVQVKEDEDAAQASAIEMKSPLHGYASGSDIQDRHYQSTGHLWRDAMNSIVGNTVSHIKEKTKIKLDQAAKDKLETRQKEWSDKVADPKHRAFGLKPGDDIYDQAYYEHFPELITKKAKEPK